jgi:hypothetical protein
MLHGLGGLSSSQCAAYWDIATANIQQFITHSFSIARIVKIKQYQFKRIQASSQCGLNSKEGMPSAKPVSPEKHHYPQICLEKVD